MSHPGVSQAVIAPVAHHAKIKQLRLKPLKQAKPRLIGKGKAGGLILHQFGHFGFCVTHIERRNRAARPDNPGNQRAIISGIGRGNRHPVPRHKAPSPRDALRSCPTSHKARDS